MSKPTAARVRELLHYDPLSGVFTWKVRCRPQTPVGTIAGRTDKDGYISVGINKKLYKAHRLAHLYMTGEWPAEQIDHINGVRSDNRWSNLREATNQQNQMNTRKQSNNTSGFKGASWSRTARKWQAMVGINGKQYSLGYFDTPEAASAMYEGAAAILFGNFKRATTITITEEYRHENQQTVQGRS